LPQERPEVLLIGPARPVIAKGLSDFAVHNLPTADAFLASIAQVRAVVVSAPVESVNEALFARLPNLQIIASFGVGYDHVDATAAAHPAC
jgi:phosphoglycerate dehydrogenase-like enzyme